MKLKRNGKLIKLNCPLVFINMKKQKIAIWVRNREVQVIRFSADIELEIIDMDMTDEYPQDRFDQLETELPFIVY